MYHRLYLCVHLAKHSGDLNLTKIRTMYHTNISTVCCKTLPRATLRSSNIKVQLRKITDWTELAKDWNVTLHSFNVVS